MITVGLIARCLTIAYMPMFAVLQQVHRCAKKHVQQSSSLLSIRQQFVKGRRMHVGMYTFFLSLLRGCLHKRSGLMRLPGALSRVKSELLLRA